MWATIEKLRMRAWSVMKREEIAVRTHLAKRIKGSGIRWIAKRTPPGVTGLAPTASLSHGFAAPSRKGHANAHAQIAHRHADRRDRGRHLPHQYRDRCARSSGRVLLQPLSDRR